MHDVSNIRVLIVGGGIIGCSIARELRRRGGCEVTIVEASRLGQEASWAGAGMLAPGGEFKDIGLWSRRAQESLRLYPEWVAGLAAETGVAIDYRACGALEFPESSGDWPALQRRAVEQTKQGIFSEAGDGFLFYPDDAMVDPRAVMAALEASLRATGVEIREQARVARIEPQGVMTEGGEVIEGDFVVVAAGAWASGLVDGGPATYPVKGHLIGYNLDRESFPQIQRRGHFYVLQRSNGFTIAGSTMERVGFDRTVDPATVERLAGELRNFIPDLPERPHSAWVGFRPGSDGDPVVGRWRESNVWLAYGHYRNGILLAPITARIVADEILQAVVEDSQVR